MNVLSLAIEDIGYTESPPNSNKQKYGVWYGTNGVPYCMMAVQYWHAKANATLPYKTASCSALLKWYKTNHPECIKTFPEPGAIIIYNFGHTGLVESFNATSIVAIEANTSSGESGSQNNGGGVYRRKRNKSVVDAYIHPWLIQVSTKGEKIVVNLKVLRKSNKNSQVKTLQRLLFSMGYACGNIDGDFGTKTLSAVLKYQKDNSLLIDGIVGKDTWKSLLGVE